MNMTLSVPLPAEATRELTDATNAPALRYSSYGESVGPSRSGRGSSGNGSGSSTMAGGASPSTSSRITAEPSGVQKSFAKGPADAAMKVAQLEEAEAAWKKSESVVDEFYDGSARGLDAPPANPVLRRLNKKHDVKIFTCFSSPSGDAYWRGYDHYKMRYGVASQNPSLELFTGDQSMSVYREHLRFLKHLHQSFLAFKNPLLLLKKVLSR